MNREEWLRGVPLEQLRRLYRPEGERASDAVLEVLAARGLAAGEDVRAALGSCRDASVLRQRLRQAALPSR